MDGPGANVVYFITNVVFLPNFESANASIDPLSKPYFLYSGSQITQNVKSYLEAISKLKSPGKFIRSCCPDRTGPVCSTDWTIQSIILRIKTRKATLNFSLKANYNPHILKAMMESGLKGLGQIRDRRIFRASQPIPYSNLNRIRCYNCLNK